MSYFRIGNLTPLVIALLAVAMTSAAFAKEARQPIDLELEKYWNVENPVPTMTNQTYDHKGSFEGTLGLGVVPNDSYYLPIPITVRAAYHMSENVALEASFSYLGLGPNSDLHTFLKEAGKQGLLQGVRKPTQMTLAASFDLMYSPFHGKLGIFDKKISSFDIGMVLGLGLILADVDETPDIEDALSSAALPAGHWGLSLRFFLTKWLTIRADYRQFAYQPQDALLFPVEMTIGVSFFSK